MKTSLCNFLLAFALPCYYHAARIGDQENASKEVALYSVEKLYMIDQTKSFVS